jgi:hypothetical protein
VTLALLRHRFEPARALEPWRGSDKRCRWMSRPRNRFAISLVRTPARLAVVGGPVEYRMAVDGLESFPGADREGWVGSVAPVRLVRDGRRWATPAGEFSRKALAIASALREVFETTADEAERWAEQGWIPGRRWPPWFLPNCMAGAHANDPDDGCPDCAKMGWLRLRVQEGKLPRWR